METEVDISNTMLSHDMMFRILLLLPAKSLAQFRFVSKSWYKFIRHPLFINMHLVRSTKVGKLFIRDLNHCFYMLDNFQEPNQVIDVKKSIFRDFNSDSARDQLFAQEIWGSCNGLLCIQFFRMNDGVSTFYVWNPTTMEYRDIPPMRKHLSSNNNAYSSNGFGYNLDDYEFLTLTCFGDRNSSRSAVDVYSLRKNSWRTLADIPYETWGVSELLVPCNGAFHWITMTYDEKIRYPLIAYNPRNEKCVEIPLPDLILDRYSIVFEFEGKLCVQHRSNLWMMREYGVRDSWTNLFNVNEESTRQIQIRSPLCSTESGYIVIKCSGGTIALYEPEKKSFSPIEFHYRAHKAIYCAETIAAIDINV